MYKKERIPLAVDDKNRSEVKSKEGSVNESDDFNIAKITEEFIKLIESNDGNSDQKFTELVEAMTKKAFFEINKLDDELSKTKDREEIDKIKKEQKNIKANLIKSVSEIEHLSSNYNSDNESKK